MARRGRQGESDVYLSMRFDFRNPAFAGTSMADRYAAALDMAEWADNLGIAASIAVSEHHGSADGYIFVSFCTSVYTFACVWV